MKIPVRTQNEIINDVKILKRARLKMGLSQEKFAEFLGISKYSLADYETLRTPVPMYLIERIKKLDLCD